MERVKRVIGGLTMKFLLYSSLMLQSAMSVLLLCSYGAVGAAASSSQDQVMRIPDVSNQMYPGSYSGGDGIKLIGSDGEAHVPRSYAKYAKLLQSMANEYEGPLEISVGNFAKAELDAMTRLLDLRLRAESSEQLSEMISQDVEYKKFGSEQLCKLFEFADYLNCDQIVMEGLVKRCIPAFVQSYLAHSREQDFVPQLAADNEKRLFPLLATRLYEETAKPADIPVAYYPYLRHRLDGFFNKALKKRIPLFFEYNNKFLRDRFHGDSLYKSAGKCSRDGRYQFVMSNGSVSYIQNPQTGKNVRSLQGMGLGPAVFSPSCDHCAGIGINDKIQIIDIQTGDLIYAFNGDGAKHFCDVIYSPDGRQLALGGLEKVFILDIESGQFVKEFAYVGPVRYDPTYPEMRIGYAVGPVAYSLDGLSLAAALDKTVRIWHPQTGKLMHTLEGHDEDVKFIAFSPCGRYISTASSDVTVRIWDVLTGKCLYILPGEKCPQGLRYKLSEDGSLGLLLESSCGERCWRTFGYMHQMNNVDELRFLLIAADDWQNGRAHKVEHADNSVYQNVVARFSNLQDDRLFVPTTEEKIVRWVTQVNRFASQNTDRLVLRAHLVKAYDVFYDIVRQVEDANENDNEVFEKCINKFRPRSLVWQALLALRNDLTKQYTSCRAARDAQLVEIATVSIASSSSSGEPSHEFEQSVLADASSSGSVQDIVVCQPEESTVQPEQPQLQDSVSFLRRYTPALVAGAIGGGVAGYALYKTGMFEKIKAWRFW